MVNTETFADRLTDEIIAVASENGVDLSSLDVKNIAIYTLHGILTATGSVEVNAVKKSVCEIIGDSDKIGNYLFITLSGISATDDAIAPFLRLNPFIGWCVLCS